MSLKLKLFIGVIFISISLLALAVISYVSLNNVVNQYNLLVSQSVPKLGDISGLRARAGQLRADAAKLALFSHDKDYAQKASDGLKTAINRYRSISEEYRSKQFFSKLEESKFNEVDQKAKLVLQTAEKILDSHIKNNSNKLEEIRNLINLAEEQSQEHQTLLLDLDDYIVETSSNWSNQSNQMAKRSKYVLIIISVITLTISAIATLLFALHLSRSLQSIAHELNQSAKNVEESTQTVNNASSVLSSSSTQQAAALQQTVTATTEVASMVETTAINTKNSVEKAKQSLATANAGQVAITNMLQSIDSISGANQQISQQIAKSSDEMKEIITLIHNISEKTKVINEIVFQTKLLSFNASVEASRAGEAGRGFSVVAEEISNLAAMSGGAAEEIKNLLEVSKSNVETMIKSIQTSIGQLVQNGNNKINDGVQTASECKKILENIYINVEEMVEINNQIFNATKEQSIGINEINSALEQIGLATNLNADTSRQCQETSEKLNQEVLNTNSIVNNLLNVVNGN